MKFGVFAINETHESAPFCEKFHHVACPYLFVLSQEEGASLFNQYSDGLIDLPRQLNSDTFAVTVNKAFNMERLLQIWMRIRAKILRTLEFGVASYNQSITAKIVWRNILRPESDRLDANDFATLELQSIACPSETCPYLHSNLTDCSKPIVRVLIEPSSVQSLNSRPAAVIWPFSAFSWAALCSRAGLQRL
ncbi:hypothetical protein PFISCL1PPCAC_4087, partial [Pristionchus fissidentatus]